MSENYEDDIGDLVDRMSELTDADAAQRAEALKQGLADYDLDDEDISLLESHLGDTDEVIELLADEAGCLEQVREQRALLLPQRLHARQLGLRHRVSRRANPLIAFLSSLSSSSFCLLPSLKNHAHHASPKGPVSNSRSS